MKTGFLIDGINVSESVDCRPQTVEVQRYLVNLIVSSLSACITIVSMVWSSKDGHVLKGIVRITIKTANI